MFFRSVEGPRYLEDRDYAFVEYGGSNIVHWSFTKGSHREEDPAGSIDVETLCGEAFVLCDEDGVGGARGSKKAERHRLLAEALGDRFALTAGREVENMLPEQVIRSVATRRDASIDTAALVIDRRKHRAALLCTYLNTQCHAAGGERNWAAESGTILDKVSFAEAACEFLAMSSFSELDEDVQHLVRRMAGHISAFNTTGSRSRGRLA